VKPLVVGIVNTTPDSFFDGGRDADHAIAHAQRLVSEGADWLDIGGESTRPGALAIDADQEWKRVRPVIEAMAGVVPLSIDTTKPSVARRAAAAGATILNDVQGLENPEMICISELFENTIVMHGRGNPRTMLSMTQYEDLVLNVRDHLLARAALARSPSVWIDPGIGFAKTAEQSLSLLKHLHVFTETNIPVLIGASRKSFIGKTLDLPHPERRLWGSMAAAAASVQGGAAALRVHDVEPTRHVVDLLWAINNAS